jgi:hypothetical protein
MDVRIMGSQKEKVKNFLKNYGMDPESLDLSRGCEDYPASS